MDNFKGKYLEAEIDKFTQLIEHNINTRNNLSQLKKILKEYWEYQRTKEFTEKEESLSARENDCYQLLMQGKTNAEIAKELWIEENTVKKHIGNIYIKMGVKNKGQLMAR